MARKIYPNAQGAARPKAPLQGPPDLALPATAVDEATRKGEVQRVSEIIDLGEYLRRRDEGREPASTFCLWGAEGERSRFALPLWRAIYLAAGERGGIVWEAEDGGATKPFVVLDLGSDPARTDFAWRSAGLDTSRVPEVLPGPEGGLAVYLGSEAGKRWFLLLAGGDHGLKKPDGRNREDILFLAGECAGLLFLRDFASGAT